VLALSVVIKLPEVLDALLEAVFVGDGEGEVRVPAGASLAINHFRDFLVQTLLASRSIERTLQSEKMTVTSFSCDSMVYS